jgi:hypothetical protein
MEQRESGWESHHGYAPMLRSERSGTMTTSLTLAVLPRLYSIGKLAPSDPVPAWATQGDLFCVARTADELSVLCADEMLPDEVQAERGWRALRVLGTLDFALIGILAALVTPLAAAGISIFAFSTFDTDYALRIAGHQVLMPDV